MIVKEILLGYCLKLALIFAGIIVLVMILGRNRDD